eukprot:109616-Amphidinium_carterae.1
MHSQKISQKTQKPRQTQRFEGWWVLISKSLFRHPSMGGWALGYYKPNQTAWCQTRRDIMPPDPSPPPPAHK